MPLGAIKPTPHKVCYPITIEECISILEPAILEKLPANKSYLSRWICLKLIDGDEKILDSICKNLNITLLEDLVVSLKLIAVNAKLSNDNIKDSDSFRDRIVSSIVFKAESLACDVCTFANSSYNERDHKIDKILTSKKFGIPIMIVFLGLIFWITIVGANYPSSLLSNFFNWLNGSVLWFLNFLHFPKWLTGILVDGIYTTLTWVISVMLPPMAIFFPLFTLLEDLGYLPRISFNLDKYFKKACSSRKTSINHVHGIWL